MKISHNRIRLPGDLTLPLQRNMAYSRGSVTRDPKDCNVPEKPATTWQRVDDDTIRHQHMVDGLHNDRDDVNSLRQSLNMQE